MCPRESGGFGTEWDTLATLYTDNKKEKSLRFVFWDVTLCCMVYIYEHFGGTCLSFFCPAGGGSIYL
jgi:hypothetical protein